MTRWPWITAAIAAVLCFNPLGLEILKATIFPSATDWLAYFWRNIAIAGAMTLAAAALIEWRIRLRILRRRASAPTYAKAEGGRADG